MSPIREAIVAEARLWVGTRWSHQQRQRGIGVDCAGLLVEVGKANSLTTFDIRDYAREPNGTLLAICKRELRQIPIATMRPGDVVALAYDGEPMHLGIVAPYKYGDGVLAIIHASRQRGKVCEHRIDWHLQKLIVAAFAYLGVDD